MFNYDLIKRNKCLITIGKTQKSGLTMVMENKPKPRGFGQSERCNPDEDDGPKGPVYESSNYQAEEVRVPCYFLSVPKPSFQSNFSEQDDLLSKIMGPVADGLHTANMMLPAISYVNNNLGTVMDAAGAAYNTIFQGEDRAVAGGQNKGSFGANKSAAVMGNIKKVLDVFGNAASRETRTFRAGNVVSWQGSSPVEFTLEVIFCKPNEGVHMGALYGLHEAVGFSELMFGNFMYGPRGFNSAGFGIGAMQKILNGEFPSLHSLRLWYSAEDDFNADREQQRTIILDLFRLLVITSLQVETSEQLFFDPSLANNGAPLYKWIKATIGFKTACPVPGALFSPQLGGNERGGMNATSHDFYGSMSATTATNYATPISDKGIASKWQPSERDLLRNIGRDINHREVALNDNFSAT